MNSVIPSHGVLVTAGKNRQIPRFHVVTGAADSIFRCVTPCGAKHKKSTTHFELLDTENKGTSVIVYQPTRRNIPKTLTS
jgi:hypothetical protein